MNTRSAHSADRAPRTNRAGWRRSGSIHQSADAARAVETPAYDAAASVSKPRVRSEAAEPSRARPRSLPVPPASPPPASGRNPCTCPEESPSPGPSRLRPNDDSTSAPAGAKPDRRRPVLDRPEQAVSPAERKAPAAPLPAPAAKPCSRPAQSPPAVRAPPNSSPKSPVVARHALASSVRLTCQCSGPSNGAQWDCESRFRFEPNSADPRCLRQLADAMLGCPQFWSNRFHCAARETEFCRQRLAGDIGRRPRENGRYSVRRPWRASLTDRNCEGFCHPGNWGGLPGLDGGAEGIQTDGHRDLTPPGRGIRRNLSGGRFGHPSVQYNAQHFTFALAPGSDLSRAKTTQ